MYKLIVITVMFLINFTSCGTSVKRITGNEVTDLSGNWSHLDYVEASQKLTKCLLASKWIEDYVEEKQLSRKPIILLDRVRSKVISSLINTQDLVSNLKRALMNSGKVNVIIGGKSREEIRKERESREEHSSMKENIASEVKADVILNGWISESDDHREAGFLTKRTEYRTYIVNIELTDIRTNLQLWSGKVEIVKHIKG